MASAHSDLSVAYSAYRVATNALLQGFGAAVIAHDLNDRDKNPKPGTADGNSARPGQAFEKHLAAPVLARLRPDGAEVCNIVEQANEALSFNGHPFDITSVDLTVPKARDHKGRQTEEKFYDFTMDVTFRSGDASKKLAVPVNIKWSNGKGPEHACAARMLQWISGLSTDPTVIKKKPIIDVKADLAHLAKALEAQLSGQLALIADERTVPSDYHFLVFDKPQDDKRWTSSAHATSLLSVDVNDGLVWTVSERWPHINMRFHADQINDQARTTSDSFDARRLELIKWIANKTVEVHRADPLVELAD